MKRERIIYYQDELNDDFAGNNIKVKPIKNNYKYIRRSWIFKVNAFCIKYLIAVPILWFLDTFIFRVKIENKKVLKYFKKKGYYIYANHVLPYDPIILPLKTHLKKKTVIISGHELFSINPIISDAVSHLYAIPTPNNDKEMFDRFTECMSYYINKGERVLIFPEAHIWPYYNNIRNFKAVSFRFPVNDNVPIFIATTTFKKRKGNRKPRPIIYIDGPIYPDENLSIRDRINDLREKAYEMMCYRAHQEGNFAYIEYKKKDE